VPHIRLNVRFKKERRVHEVPLSNCIPMIEALSPEQLRRMQFKERAAAEAAARAAAKAAAAAAARAAAEAEFVNHPAIKAAARMPVYNPLALDIPLFSSGNSPTGKLPSSFLEGEYGFKESSNTDFMSSSASGGGSAADAMARSSTLWSSGSGSGIGIGNSSGTGSSGGFLGMHGPPPLSPVQHRSLDYSELNIDSPNSTGGSAFVDEDGGLSSAAAAVVAAMDAGDNPSLIDCEAFILAQQYL
jgi:hypothetical protein